MTHDNHMRRALENRRRSALKRASLLLVEGALCLVPLLAGAALAEAAELLAVRVAPQAVAQAVRAMADMRATDVWGAISIHKSPQA